MLLTLFAVEALYARNTNPVMNLLALEGTKALAESLPVIVNSPYDVDARSKAQYGAWLCERSPRYNPYLRRKLTYTLHCSGAMCLGAVGMSIHHKLCHTLGGSFNL